MYQYPMMPYQAMNPYPQQQQHQQQTVQLFQPAPQLSPQSVVQISSIYSTQAAMLLPRPLPLALDYDDRHVYAVFADDTGAVTTGTYQLLPCGKESRLASNFATAQSLYFIITQIAATPELRERVDWEVEVKLTFRKVVAYLVIRER